MSAVSERMSLTHCELQKSEILLMIELFYVKDMI